MKNILLAALVICGSASYARDTDAATENKLLEAYSSMQYATARQLSKKSDRPEFQLIRALCDVFDRRSQNLKRGIPKLAELSQSTALAPRYRILAKLSYARAMHTLALRKTLYPEANNVDPVPLYNEVIALAPGSIDAVCAAIYRTQYLFETDKADEAFAGAEDFIRTFKGENPRYICAMHLMLKDDYIRVRNDYIKAVKHAEKARELVPANPNTIHTLHFKIARMYDFYIKDSVKAEQEYVSFIKKFPDTAEAVIARRFLKELRERNKK